MGSSRLSSIAFLVLPSTLVLACGADDPSSDTSAGSGDLASAGANGSGDVEPGDTNGSGDVEYPNGMVPCEPLNTGFEGDELCILPPEPGTGLHMHVGPKDYDDPDQVAEFIMEPGNESTEYYRFNATNEEQFFFYVQHYRMRPGSHHLIMNMLMYSQVEEEGWATGRLPEGTMTMPIGGTQTSVLDYPPNGEIPPEDAELGRPFAPRAGMSFEMHYINATEEPILREAWVNLMNAESPRPKTLGGLFLIGAFFEVPPRASQINNYTAVLDEPQKRIVSIFGHRHANADRFSVWAHRKGERTLVYEDYDYGESAELFYNTVVQNPTPDREKGIAGGYSGLLVLEEGDALEWECEVSNRTDGVLRVGNEVYTAEMCNLFGSTADGESLIWRGRPDLVVK